MEQLYLTAQEPSLNENKQFYVAGTKCRKLLVVILTYFLLLWFSCLFRLFYMPSRSMGVIACSTPMTCQ